MHRCLLSRAFKKTPLVPASRSILDPRLCRYSWPQFHAQLKPKDHSWLWTLRWACWDSAFTISAIGPALIVNVGPVPWVLPESHHIPSFLPFHCPLECEDSKLYLWTICGRVPLPGSLFVHSMWHDELAFPPTPEVGELLCIICLISRCGSSQAACPVVFPQLCLTLSEGIAEKCQNKGLTQTKSPSKADILELLFWWEKRLKLLFKMRLGFSVDITYKMTTNQKLFLLSPLVTNSSDSLKIFPRYLKCIRF